MHKVPTGRLLPCQLEMLPRYIKEAVTERGKCYYVPYFSSEEKRFSALEAAGIFLVDYQTTSQLFLNTDYGLIY